MTETDGPKNNKIKKEKQMDRLKETYVEVKTEIICFSSIDVIATSGEFDGDGSLGGDGGTGGWTGT